MKPTVQLTIRIDPSIFEQIEIAAAKRHTTVSKAVVDAITLGIKHLPLDTLDAELQPKGLR